MLAGQLVEFLAATAVCGLDQIAGFIEVLLVVAEKDALAAGGAEWSAIPEMRLTFMRAADLLIERRRMTAGQTR